VSAQSWFRKYSKSGWATCPITQSGFIRVSSNPTVISEAASPQQAIAKLEEIVALKGHFFWSCDLPFDRKGIPFGLVMGYRQVTDAYLLGLTIRNDGRLVTFDRAVSSLIPRESPLQKHIQIIDTRT
jgi:hypothetical protein